MTGKPAVHIALPDGFGEEMGRIAAWLCHLATGLTEANADQAQEAARRLRCMATAGRIRFMP